MHQTLDLQNALITMLREELLLYEPRHEMTLLCHLGTTKAQINLRIRAVWSTPFLFGSFMFLKPKVTLQFLSLNISIPVSIW